MEKKIRIHVQNERENERKSLTVASAICKFPDDSIISIATKEYGVFWIGRAKFAFSHISFNSMRKPAKIVGQQIIIG